MDPQEAHTTHPEIPEQDPAHDIDGRKTWTWLLGCAAGVFVTVWLLDIVFHTVTFNQRVKVIENAPTTQLDQLRKQEAEALSAGQGRISIDQSIEDYLNKR